MDIGSKKQWLWRYQDALREVESLERLEREERLAATGMAAKVVDGQPGPPVRSGGAGMAGIRHMEISADLERARARADRVRREILDAASALGGYEAVVVRYRYINGYGWGRMRDVTGYSRSWLQRKHRSALLRIECGQKWTKVDESGQK